MHKTVIVLCIYAILQLNVNAKCPDIVSKTRWGGRFPKIVDYSLTPVEYVIIHHTVSDNCTSEIECSDLISNIQDFHMDELKFDDIGYNFLIGGDGRIYEGVGFHRIGAHTYGYNSRSLGIAFIGNYVSTAPSEKQVESAKALLECAVEKKELDERYKLYGGRQVSATKSPGLALYHEIQTWEHFTRTP